MIALTIIMLTALLTSSAARMLTGHWMPVHCEHVELDFRALTLGGIPIEEIYGPDAVRHPYPLSEPLDPWWLFTETPFFEPREADAFASQVAQMRAAWRIGAHLQQPGCPIHHIDPC